MLSSSRINDLQDYFSSFNPVSFEQLSSDAANVVWALPFSAAKTILGLSKRLASRQEEEAMEVNERVAGEDDEVEKPPAILTKEQLAERVRNRVSALVEGQDFIPVPAPNTMSHWKRLCRFLTHATYSFSLMKIRQFIWTRSGKNRFLLVRGALVNQTRSSTWS